MPLRDSRAAEKMRHASTGIDRNLIWSATPEGIDYWEYVFRRFSDFSQGFERGADFVRGQTPPPRPKAETSATVTNTLEKAHALKEIAQTFFNTVGFDTTSEGYEYWSQVYTRLRDATVRDAPPTSTMVINSAAPLPRSKQLLLLIEDERRSADQGSPPS